MEDQSGKFIRLFGSIFFSLIGFILAMVLLMLGVKLLFGLMSYIPWSVYVYMLFIILVPATLFITVYLIFFRRTKSHPAYLVRLVSYFLFCCAIITWLISLVRDIFTFSKHAYPSIGMYWSYDMFFLAINVAVIFLIGVMQAFSTAKEKDWMERVRE